MTILARYDKKYVGLKLSDSSTGYGKLEKEEDIFFLHEAWLPSGGAIDGMLRTYLSMQRSRLEGRDQGFKTYQISEEHVTAIRDISYEVAEVESQYKENESKRKPRGFFRSAIERFVG